MSATSARRPKERSSAVLAGAKPLKPVTPVEISGDGKENGLQGRVRTRPVSHSATRPERPAGVCRWSTSSAPRGRSPSPSEFSRDRSRVSSEKSVSRAGKSVPRVRVSDSVRERKGSETKEDNGRSKSVARVTVSRARKEEIGKQCDALETKEVSGAREGKYQSKLHEKLAFLEGKVKRIATDIKKTKEMLDQNNPDASKVILLDIQDKITGIEEAMSCVGGDPKMEEKKVHCSGKSSVKGLNSEELEARLFPHHKLLRNRTAMVKASSENSEKEHGNPVDANPIAIEFLASLSKDQEKTDLESCEDEAAEDADFEEVKENVAVRVRRNDGVEINLTTDETFEDIDDKENTTQGMDFEEEIVDNFIEQVDEIGCKTSTCGWFVSEGELALLAHGDGSCSLHDVVNNEEKTVYQPPLGTPENMWRDCWVIRAPSADGCAGRYVVAASAGSSMDSGFCSWDYYTKEVCAFHSEKGKTTSSSSRTALGPLPNNLASNPRNSEARQWWCKPCGPLVAVTASWQRAVRVFDVRDGEKIMNWNVSSSVLRMDFSSPLQWRNRGKVVVGEMEAVSFWDVSSLSSQALLSVPSSGRVISALHVNNSDAELGGGVRQRLSSSEAEGNDGVFCTQDAINVLDFRLPNGVGLKIPKLGVTAHSVFSRGDSVFLGCSNTRQGLKQQSSSEIQQFSLRKQRLFCSYPFPESNDVAITQVWGNSSHVMGVCGLGLFVFDALKENDMPSFKANEGSTNTQCVREIVGQDDMYSPSFDYSSERALVVSRDRPAMLKRLS